MKPKSNGIVELVDEKNNLDGASWNCMDFWIFSSGEYDKSWEASHARFLQAKSGHCPYRTKCKRYSRTIELRKRDPKQLTLF